MSATPKRCPRVLVSGIVLDQPMGGVRRHNAELLPRAARLLEEGGGGIALLEGRVRAALELPASIERLASNVPSHPTFARARGETAALAKALRHAARAGRPFDLVHTAHFPAPRRLAVPFTLTVHDLRRVALRSQSLLRRMAADRVIASGVRRAACTIVVSASMRAEIEARFAPPRIALVPNAADHLPVLPRAPGPGAPLLHVGHLEPRKNLELLLHALALDPALPDLQLAGAPKAKEAERLARLAEQLGVRARVHFLGPVEEEELARLYSVCACVVLPSRLEGFGIPVLEAQRAGAPLAIAEVHALREVAGEDVPRFSPDDAAACVDALHAAIGQGPEATDLARQRAAACFGWDDSARALVDAWCEASGFASGFAESRSDS